MFNSYVKLQEGSLAGESTISIINPIEFEDCRVSFLEGHSCRYATTSPRHLPVLASGVGCGSSEWNEVSFKIKE